MLCLGMGNGAVFQLVPQRFRQEIGVMTGVIGMTGGVGGFYLASSLGFSKQYTGGYGLGFLIFALLAARRPELASPWCAVAGAPRGPSFMARRGRLTMIAKMLRRHLVSGRKRDG